MRAQGVDNHHTPQRNMESLSVAMAGSRVEQQPFFSPPASPVDYHNTFDYNSDNENNWTATKTWYSQNEEDAAVALAGLAGEHRRFSSTSVSSQPHYRLSSAPPSAEAPEGYVWNLVPAAQVRLPPLRELLPDFPSTPQHSQYSKHHSTITPAASRNSTPKLFISDPASSKSGWQITPASPPSQAYSSAPSSGHPTPTHSLSNSPRPIPLADPHPSHAASGLCTPGTPRLYQGPFISPNPLQQCHHRQLAPLAPSTWMSNAVPEPEYYKFSSRSQSPYSSNPQSPRRASPVRTSPHSYSHRQEPYALTNRPLLPRTSSPPNSPSPKASDSESGAEGETDEDTKHDGSVKVECGGSPPGAKKHCNKPYTFEQEIFFIYHRIDLEMTWTEVLRRFMDRFPARVTGVVRTVGGLECAYYRTNLRLPATVTTAEGGEHYSLLILPSRPGVDGSGSNGQTKQDNNERLSEKAYRGVRYMTTETKCREARVSLMERWPEELVDEKNDWVLPQHREEAKLKAEKRRQQREEWIARRQG
ncbi:hypothetical protein QBC46DRAFT_157999 [Diplogelasinospora grovesii]|uniref:Uncharacterized protein n=1 Tax=Diplogelasinospora grovesii TaxID=303347 RepID=A0AAN6NFR2_9PEZI|nr:hypothetical protein QBC46DRAFT_157999 [Diplogelasinospora grovesii]